jgi:purine-binding chemotaxis protein CheW
MGGDLDDLWTDLDVAILRRRAEALAQPRADAGGAAETLALLQFTLMEADYAIPLVAVEAVLRIGQIVSIPLTPKHIQGVIRRRGQTIALVSLRHFFHPEFEGLADADFAVIVVAGGKRFALQAEEIEGVVYVPKDELKPAAENFDRAQAPFVVAVTVGGLTVLDVERLVATSEFGMDKPRGTERART